MTKRKMGIGKEDREREISDGKVKKKGRGGPESGQEKPRVRGKTGRRKPGQSRGRELNATLRYFPSPGRRQRRFPRGGIIKRKERRRCQLSRGPARGGTRQLSGVIIGIMRWSPPHLPRPTSANTRRKIRDILGGVGPDLSTLSPTGINHLDSLALPYVHLTLPAPGPPLHP